MYWLAYLFNGELSGTISFASLCNELENKINKIQCQSHSTKSLLQGTVRSESLCLCRVLLSFDQTIL